MSQVYGVNPSFAGTEYPQEKRKSSGSILTNPIVDFVGAGALAYLGTNYIDWFQKSPTIEEVTVDDINRGLNNKKVTAEQKSILEKMADYFKGNKPATASTVGASPTAAATMSETDFAKHIEDVLKKDFRFYSDADVRMSSIVPDIASQEKTVQASAQKVAEASRGVSQAERTLAEYKDQQTFYRDKYTDILDIENMKPDPAYKTPATIRTELGTEQTTLSTRVSTLETKAAGTTPLTPTEAAELAEKKAKLETVNKQITDYDAKVSRRTTLKANATTDGSIAKMKAELTELEAINPDYIPAQKDKINSAIRELHDLDADLADNRLLQQKINEIDIRKIQVEQELTDLNVKIKQTTERKNKITNTNSPEYKQVAAELEDLEFQQKLKTKAQTSYDNLLRDFTGTDRKTKVGDLTKKLNTEITSTHSTALENSLITARDTNLKHGVNETALSLAKQAKDAGVNGLTKETAKKALTENLSGKLQAVAKETKSSVAETLKGLPAKFADGFKEVGKLMAEGNLIKKGAAALVVGTLAAMALGRKDEA